MRLKTSYFNPTLFKKNLARFWPLWGGASLVGALFPLYFLTVLLRERGIGAVEDPLGVTYGYYTVVAYAVPVISLVYAVLCALAVWGWLYNAKSVGMYHALPVTRRGLFLTDFLSGMAMMLIPYAVTGALCVAVSALVRGVDPAGLLVTVLCVLGESLFFFASASAVVFITGNPFACAAFYFLFHFFAAGAEWLICQLMTLFYFGVEQYYEGIAEFLSPVIFLMRNVSVHTTSQQITMPGGWIESGKIESVTLAGGWIIAVYALAGLVLLGCAWALYRRRRSESAGDVVAVGWMKPVFRYGFALCAAVAGGMLLYNLFFYTGSTETARPAPMAFCMAAAGAVGYYIASMLLSKSLRVFRGSWKGLLATVLVSAALCFAAAADPFGVETWIPDAAEIEKAGLDLGYGGHMYVNFTDGAAVGKLLDLHRAILSEEPLLNKRHGEELWTSDYTGSGYLELYYWVNGRRVSRAYRIPFSTAASQLETLKKAEILVTDPAVQEASIFDGLSYYDGEEIAETRPIHGYVTEVYNTAAGEFENLDLTAEQAEAVEAALRRDIQAGRVGRTMFLPDEERDQSVYSGCLQLDYSVTLKPGDRYPKGGTETRGVSLEFSTYCTETVKALEDLLGEERRLLTSAERNQLTEHTDLGVSGGYYDGAYYGYADTVVYPHPGIVYPGEAF